MKASAHAIEISKPIRRGRTRAQRVAILNRLFAEVDRDPELRRDIRRFVKAAARSLP